MTHIVFFRDRSSRFIGFSVSGHSGYADEGSDIVCAAVSACTELVLNQLDGFGCDTDCTVDPESASVRCEISFASEATNESRNIVHTLLDGFCRTMKDTADEYSRFLKCTITEV